jgi:hypothetical protein
MEGQFAFGETGSPKPRRFLITTAPIDIAARTTIAIKIGIKGEEPSSSDVAGETVESFPGAAGLFPSAPPLPG